jgi:hypothetical protein
VLTHTLTHTPGTACHRTLPLSGRCLWLTWRAQTETEARLARGEDVDGDEATAAAAHAEARTSVVAAWTAYFTFEKAVDKARAVAVLQRATAACFWDAALWLRFGTFVSEEVGDVHLAASVFKRAAKNCLWSSDLWVGLITALERLGDAPALDATAQEAIAITFSSIQDYLLVRCTAMLCCCCCCCCCCGCVLARLLCFC